MAVGRGRQKPKKDNYLLVPYPLPIQALPADGSESRHPIFNPKVLPRASTSRNCTKKKGRRYTTIKRVLKPFYLPPSRKKGRISEEKGLQILQPSRWPPHPHNPRIFCSSSGGLRTPVGILLPGIFEAPGAFKPPNPAPQSPLKSYQVTPMVSGQEDGRIKQVKCSVLQQPTRGETTSLKRAPTEGGAPELT